MEKHFHETSEIVYTEGLERTRHNLEALNQAMAEAKAELANTRSRLLDVQMKLSTAEAKSDEESREGLLWEIGQLQATIDLFEEEIRSKQAEASRLRSEMHCIMERARLISGVLTEETRGQEPN